MIERWDRLSQFHFQAPEITAALLVSVLRWMMAGVFIAGVLWLVSALMQRRGAASKAVS
jgi:hypothetical protein